MNAAGLRLSYESLFSLTKELGFLLRSGVPLYRALQIIRQQTKDQALNLLLTDCIGAIAEGSSFSACLAKYPKVFSAFYRQMIMVGENQGGLESALKRIELYLETQKDLREKITGALTYPAILLSMGLLIALGMLFFVFPRFAEIFLNSGMRLPLPTRIIMGLYHFFTNFYVYILLAVLGLGCFYGIMLIKKNTRLYLHIRRLQYPVLGTLFLTTALARFARTLGTLSAAGVQLLEALNLSKTVLNNFVLQEEVEKVIVSVRDGRGMAKPFSRSAFFPPLFNQMVAVGEESGALDKVLLDCAVYYEQETEFLLKRYLVLLEPIALILVAGFVMLIAAAVMLPLFKMSAALRMG